MEATINLLPKQTEAWDYFEDKTTSELGYGGAAGGGKTRLGCYLAIAIAEMYPGSRGAIGRKELKNLRLTTLAELFIIFAELGYTERDYKYMAQDAIVKFSNGSEVLLLDMAYSPQDPEYTRFGSLNLTWAWCEESNESPEKGISILKTRVGRHNNFVVKGKAVHAKSFWLETFNPNKGHVHRDYYKPWKEGTLPVYRRFVRALPNDNPFLPPEYIENLKRADRVTRERLLLGNFDYDASPQKIMSYEAILDLRNNVVDTPANGQYLINDIARFGGDKIVITEWLGLCLVGLTVNRFQDLEVTKTDIKNDARDRRVPYSRILSDEDGVGGGVVDGLKGTKGFIGNAKPFEIKDTRTGKLVSENFTNMRSQCYFKLGEYVNDHKLAVRVVRFKTNIEGYTLEKALSDLEEELDQVKKVETTGQSQKFAIITKSEIKEALGRSPDLADVLMMRMYFELKPAINEAYPAWRASTVKKINPAV